MITAFILLALGLLLIFLEFFVPGGILGAAGGVFLFLSIFFFAWKAKSAWSIILFIVLVGILTFSLVRFSLWRLKHDKKGRGIYLNTDQEGYVASTFAKEYIGKKGIALSDLGPSGHIKVEGKKLQAVSKLGYIEKGEAVLVIGGEGGHLIVKKLIVSQNP